jgi:hypothetical protein
LISIEVSGVSVSNYPYTYLVGGTKGAVPSTWVPALAEIKKEFSDIIVVLSSSLTIQAEACSHLESMKLRGQKQQLFTGGESKATLQTISSSIKALASADVTYCYPGIYHKSVGGGSVGLPGYMTAALIAGRVCGVPVSEPVTFDYVSVAGLDVDLISGDPIIEDLINLGVCTLERVQGGGIRIVQGITTYTATNNTLYSEICVKRTADKLTENVRKALEDAFVGKKGIRAKQSAVITVTTEVLDEAVRNEDIVDYRNIVVRKVGTATYVDYSIAPDEPTNFMLVTSHFVNE